MPRPRGGHHGRVDHRDRVRLSRRLSRHLRHRPDEIGLTLDARGWADVEAVLQGLARSGLPVTRADLDEVVRTNDKRRFALDPSGRRIRAVQGHSVPVDLGLPAVPPPAVLWHGTAERHLAAIRRDGLEPRSRRDVHLSADPDTARRVGARHGRPVVLVVDAARMARDGHRFRRAENGVWLTDRVPPAYLTLAGPA